jgi:hypothetical protein
VYQRQVLGLGVVRVRIEVIGFAVGSPTGVGNTDGAGNVLGFSKALQVCHLAFGFIEVQLTGSGHHGDARTVIAPVFQPVQSFYQNWIGIPASQIANYTTHDITCFNGSFLGTKIVSGKENPIGSE